MGQTLEKFRTEWPVLFLDKVVLGLVVAAVIVPIQLFQDRLTLKQEQQILASTVTANVLQSSLIQLENAFTRFQLALEGSMKSGGTELKKELRMMDQASIEMSVSLDTMSAFQRSLEKQCKMLFTSITQTTHTLTDALAEPVLQLDKVKDAQKSMLGNYKSFMVSARDALVTAISEDIDQNE